MELTLMKGLMAFSSSMVEGTVGRGGARALCCLHQVILSWMACRRGGDRLGWCGGGTS